MKRLLCVLVLGVAGCASDVEVTESKQEVGAGEAFPHGVWTAFLQKYNRAGFVDYERLAANRGDLEEYLGLLAKYSPDANPGMFPGREDRLAYLINAYNAYTMRGVIDRWPIATVKFGLTGNDFWITTAYPLGPEETFTLAQIEGRLQEMNDPRIHFAINCASIGCPRLPEEAFVPERLEEQLAREAKKFVNEERNVQVEGGVVKLSSIFKWYRKDFVGSGKDRELLQYVNSVGGSVPPDAKIEYVDYDWGLNSQRK